MATINLLLTDDSRIYRQYLSQFTDDYRFVGPKEFKKEIDILLIPSVNVFSGFESEVERTGDMNVSISLDTAARTFYEHTLQQYIDNKTKIVAIGHGADMLWAKLGGKLRTITTDSGLSGVLGNYETSPLRNVSPKLGNDYTFHCSDFFEAPIFELIDRDKSVIPIAWKTELSRHDYLAKIKNTTDLLSEKGPVVAFEHIGEKMYGIKSMPTLINHKIGSEVQKKFGFLVGSPLTNSIIKFLLTDETAETVSVPIPK
jgi:hypothetical protein